LNSIISGIWLGVNKSRAVVQKVLVLDKESRFGSNQVSTPARKEKRGRAVSFGSESLQQFTQDQNHFLKKVACGSGFHEPSGLTFLKCQGLDCDFLAEA
jgi:hypothetical protein